MATRTKKRAQKEKRRASAKNKAQTRGSGNTSHLKVPEDTELFQLKAEGVKRIRIVEYEAGVGNKFAKPGEYYYERTYYAHRGIGPENEFVICPRKTLTKDNPKPSQCPICEYIAKENSKAHSDDEEIKALLPKERQLFNVYDPKNDEAGIQLWDFSYHNFGKVIDNKMKNDDEDEYDCFASPDDDGLLIKLEVAESSFAGNKYYEVTGIEFKKTEALDEDVAEGVHCLDECLNILSAKQINEKFMESAEEEEEEDDAEEDEKPKKKGRKSSKKKAEEAEPDDDEESEGSDEDGGVESEEDEGEIVVGSQVNHEEHGECEVVHISKDGKKLRIEDSDGKVHRMIKIEDVELLEEEEGEEEEEEDDDEVEEEEEASEEDDADDDEWEWDEDDEEEASEEEPPKRRRQKSKAKESAKKSTAAKAKPKRRRAASK